MKYVAYYRVSTKKQSLGLISQKIIVDNYIKSVNGYLIKSFEEKETGKNNNRIELNNAIEYCKKSNATLIIAKLDRLSRNISFIFALKESKINFYCCDASNCNTLTLGFFATIAQNEREMISERTKLALNAKKKQGIKLGAPSAKFTDKMRLKAAEVNRLKANNNANNRRAYGIINSFIEKNKSLREIAKYLNENDFRTPKNSLFTATAVKRIYERYKKGA